MHPNDRMWLTGLLEGEGHFGLHTGSQTVQLGMTDREIVERAASLMGCTVRVRIERRRNHNDIYRARVYASRARWLMVLLRPGMGARRRASIEYCLDHGPSHPRPYLNNWRQSRRS